MQQSLKFFFATILLLLLIPSYVFSQSGEISFEEFRDAIDKRYGINDILVNGHPHVLADDDIMRHPYFHNNVWIKATIYINGYTFKNKEIKYDIVKDHIILKAKLDQGKFQLVQLNKLTIDSFRFDNRLFVKSSIYHIETENPVFYEEIYNNEMILARKFMKEFVNDFTTFTPQGKYSKTIEKRYIIHDGTTINVQTQRSFIRFFPKDLRKRIRKYMRGKNIDYSKASLRELNELSEYCFMNLNP